MTKTKKIKIRFKPKATQESTSPSPANPRPMVNPVQSLPKAHRVVAPKPTPSTRPHFTPPKVDINLPAQPLAPAGLLDANGNPLTLDPDQYRALKTFVSGKHMVILGKAGTGKTTILQALALHYAYTRPQDQTSYRIKGEGQYRYGPKMAICAFTNRAANNSHARITINPTLEPIFGPNITTCHNLLEYTVEFITDPETGQTKRRYYPQRDQYNLLDIDILVLEEATTVGVGDKSLWAEIYAALPPHCIIVMLGDINQLPPVIGKPVLSYAIQSPLFEVIELTKVHRQALDNPIIRQAHNCLSGRPIETDLRQREDGSFVGVKLFQGTSKVKLPWAEFEHKAIAVLDHYRKQGWYDPMTDMILSPYNKPSTENNRAITATELGKHIANILAKEAGRKVYEVQLGFQRQYYSVGDRVYYNKEEGVVTAIRHNASYMGRAPKPASEHLDYFGKYSQAGAELDFLDESMDGDPDYDALDITKLQDHDEDGDGEERKRSASHIIEVTMHNGDIQTISAVGDFAELQLGYALSIHKSQGSEWPRVFVVIHDTNRTQLYRESLYTAMTRPRDFLGIIAQPHILEKAISTQRIKGNTLADKIEFFNGGYLDQIVPLDPEEKIGPTNEALMASEGKDCAVKALERALEIPYQRAWETLKECGRQYRKGTYDHMIERALDSLGWSYIESQPRQPSGSKYTPKTIGQYLSHGRYLAYCRGHVFALVNGKVLDWTENREHHINKVWKLKKRG